MVIIYHFPLQLSRGFAGNSRIIFMADELKMNRMALTPAYLI